MTNRSWRFRTLPGFLNPIFLFCSLALFVSIASPADDAVQQEAAPCRLRHVGRVSKTNPPAPTQSRSIPARATASVQLPFAPTHQVGINLESVLPPDEIQAHQTGDRAPPRSLL
jgi:hypothetical protein